MVSLREKQPQLSIDIRGKMCPYTLIDTRDSLKGISKGQVLEVVCDYEPAAKNTIPNFCQKKGYPIEIVQLAEGQWKIFIEKAD
ncbi:MAG TPA: sulfurtransferase TusA family protein [Candidatus Hypogeohydataceae bacterium YC38]|jgi:tRNA 2-thiouridine synthesizing protein A|nr:sulfurtransferase TusA family protein [Candidatus Brocadiales bacterium]